MPVPLSRRLSMARQHGGYASCADLARVASQLSGRLIPTDELEALESGARKLSRHLIEVAAACKVRPEWLVFGDEPMVPGGVASEVERTDLVLSADEVALIKAWRQLDVRVVKPALWALVEEWVALTSKGSIEWERARAADSRNR